MDNPVIIERVDGPQWPFVSVVGSFGKRIAFYSQQVRDLDLASAVGNRCNRRV